MRPWCKRFDEEMSNVCGSRSHDNAELWVLGSEYRKKRQSANRNECLKRRKIRGRLGGRVPEDPAVGCGATHKSSRW